MLVFCQTLPLRLTPTGTTKVRFMHAVSAALLSWTAWFDTSPNNMHVEQSSEAMVSNVARKVPARHTAYSHAVHRTFPVHTYVKDPPRHVRGCVRAYSPDMSAARSVTAYSPDRNSTTGKVVFCLAEDFGTSGLDSG